MFTPIRNLITYIQKNASGSTFFGGTPSNTENQELSEATSTEMELQSEIIESNNIIMPTEATESSLKDQNLNEISNQNQNHNNIGDHNPLQDDKSYTSTTNPFVDPLHEQNNYNDDEYIVGNDGGEEEEEEEKDIFLDFPPEDGEPDIEFPTNEVIVLNDPDLNVSMNSDPAADPLALDDYNVNLGGGLNSPNPLDSSTESNVLFVVDIDEVVNKAPRLIDDVDDTIPLKAVTAADEQELRSDGSDSGLGSETSTLQTTVTTDTSVSSIVCASPIAVEKLPLRSNLKRHLQDVVVTGQQMLKKPRRSINFDGVKVFYFPRIQGHGCVPSQGGCTLGMGAHHVSFKTFSLAEHAAELRRAHKLQLQEINPRGSSSEESDSDEELSEGSGSDLDAETNGFLQPVSPKQRRALLKAAGIRKIDANEKIECRDIRNSREVCGCVCRDFCDPDTCACSQAGIKCQVDRAMFPCGCSRDACGNVIGRIEFNPARVRTHFIHTIMRLDMENRQQKRTDEIITTSSSSSSSVPSSHLVYNNVSGCGGDATSTSPYNAMPGYNSLDQSSSDSYNHHHQLHQQYNVYNSHHPDGGGGVGLCAQMAPSMMVPAILPATHNPYSNANAAVMGGAASTEADSLALNGTNLHYPDGPIYPPPVVSYGDMLTPYANTPYETTNSTYSTANAYNSYHTSPHQQLDSSLQMQPPFLGYGPPCNGEMSDFNEAHNSFISLNTPDASSARMTAINDLLHNTRNTTTALVAVSSLETSSFAGCESSGHQSHSQSQIEQLTSELPAISNISDVVGGGECAVDPSLRPDTPPDEELPQVNQIIQNLELPKTPVETVVETSTKCDENKQHLENELKESEPPPNVELSKSEVAILNSEKDSPILNGSLDQQADLHPPQPHEIDINNTATTNLPTIETAVVSA